jgi:hypothetical protein
MEEYSNATIVRKANVYFGGRVTSRTVKFADGSRKTLGIMMAGEYEFGTDTAEDMEILAGEMEVLLPGETEWLTVIEGDVFHVPAKAKFKLKVPVVVDYCCSYD